MSYFKFIKDYNPSFFVDLETEEHYDTEEICCLLNELIKENRKLRRELNDCEKFRYQVFKKIGELNI